MAPNLEKKTPPHHVEKVEGSGDSMEPPRLYTPTIGWDTAEWVAEGSTLPKVAVGAATLCIPGVDQWPSPGCTYACHG